MSSCVAIGSGIFPAGMDRMPRQAGSLRNAIIRVFGDNGATALEFALLAPVLLLLIFGIVDLGLMLFASQEVNNAAAAAVRQLRTGSVQGAPVPSTYAGASNCANPSFTLSSTQNCIGITINSGDTASTIFGKLLCANIFDNGAFVTCTKFNWSVIGYNDFGSFSGALPTLTYNADGTPSATFCQGAGAHCASDNIIVAMVGYKRPFMTPLVGCFFDPTDCAAGRSPVMLMTYFAVFQAEPFGAGTTG